jgi:hypothetical protein
MLPKILLIVLCAVFPMQEGRVETRSYLPPGEPGYVYTVVQHAPPSAGEHTVVGIRWGPWQQTGHFRAQPGSSGVVVRVRHAKWDRVTMTVTTNGRFASGPVQGSPPPEWGDRRYERVIW